MRTSALPSTSRRPVTASTALCSSPGNRSCSLRCRGTSGLFVVSDWSGSSHGRASTSAEGNPRWGPAASVRAVGGSGVLSEVAAPLLLALDRLEECLEVALAETERAVPLDQLEEHGGPVAGGLGEDLQQVAVLVAVDQDAAGLQLLDRHAHVADPCPQLRVLVVRVRRGEELDALRAEGVHAGDDVAGRDGEVLGAGAVVELE